MKINGIEGPLKVEGKMFIADLAEETEGVPPERTLRIIKWHQTSLAEIMKSHVAISDKGKECR